MTLLASANYDPLGASVSLSTASLLAMTVIDTTNLRLTFTVPANGAVLVRLRGTVHGATTFPQILLGVLEGGTVRLRQVPCGAIKTTALATSQLSQEVLAVVPGLTPGATLTWDAAYGVEVNVLSTGLKYGGVDSNAGNNAFGGFVFEVYDAPNLLAAALYDPTGGAMVTKSTAALLAMTALDTTNLRLTFAPTTTKALVRLRCSLAGATTFPVVLLGVLNGASIVGRQQPVGGILGSAVASTNVPMEASFVVTGLTVGNTLNWDAAYAVQVLLASTAIRYGGPNNTTTNDAAGAFGFEVWAV